MFLAAALASGSSNSTMNDVEPGLLGFLVVAGIGVVLVFLLRSMNKQLRKVVPDPQWRKEAKQSQAQDQQDLSPNGTPQT